MCQKGWKGQPRWKSKNEDLFEARTTGLRSFAVEAHSVSRGRRAQIVHCVHQKNACSVTEKRKGLLYAVNNDHEHRQVVSARRGQKKAIDSEQSSRTRTACVLPARQEDSLTGKPRLAS